MSRHLTILCSISVAVLLIWSILLVRSGGDEGRSLPTPPSLEAIDESPAARERWEWQTLHDPATGRIPEDARRRELAFSQSIPSRRESVLFKGSSSADPEWTSRGPTNIGGRTRALAIDVTNERVLLAGGVTGGMWRSTDGGGSWIRRTPPNVMPSVTCIEQDRRQGHRNVWYHGTGEWRTNSTRFGNTGLLGDGIFKSVDSGLSWQQLPSTISGTPQALDRQFDIVWNIAVDPGNSVDDEVYAAVYGGIVRSTDGGTSWTSVLGGPTNSVGYTTVAVTDDGVVYAALGSGGSVRGIWRSPDGLNWTSISPPDWSDTVRRITMALAPSNPDVVYFLAETFEHGFEVDGVYGYKEYYDLYKYNYKSGNGAGSGGAWDNRSRNLPNLGGRWIFNALNSYAQTLAVHPVDENRLYLGGSSLYRSRDGCATPVQTGWLGGYDFNGNYNESGGLHPDIHTVQFLPSDPSRLYVGCDGGVYASNDDLASDTGLVWDDLNRGYVTTQYYTVAIDHGTPGSNLLMGGLQDNGTLVTSSTDAGVPWQLHLGGDGSFCAVADGGRTRYASAQGGVIYRIGTDSLGNVIDYARVDPYVPDEERLFIHPFVLDPIDNTMMYLPQGGTIWRNIDLSAIPSGSFNQTLVNWQELTITTMSRRISAIAVVASDQVRRLYYGTIDGHLYRLDNASDDPPPPKEITGSLFPTGGYINCIATDPRDHNHAMVVVTNYNVQSLFATTDGGMSWSGVGGNLEENPDGTGRGPSCRWGKIVHRGGDARYFVGATTGLFSTSQLEGASTTWVREGGESIGAARVDMIDARESDGMVAVATWGSGVFTADIPVSGVSAGGENRGTVGVRIGSIEPNPLRTSATIICQIPARTGVMGGEESNYRLSLYDIRGNEVRQILNGAVEPGERQVRVDRAGLASGVYWLRLRNGGSEDVRRVVVN